MDEYMSATIVLVQCEYNTVPIEQRLRIIPFMNEPGFKLLAYDRMCRDPVDWRATSDINPATVQAQR